MSGALVLPTLNVSLAEEQEMWCPHCGGEIDGKFAALYDRFWSKVNKDGPVPAHAPELGQCWVWTATFGTHGYGELSVDGRRETTHRLSWKMAHGEIVGGLHVLHKCDHKSCVRPSHLFLGTQLENMRDVVARGLRKPATGDRHGSRTHPERVARGDRSGARTHPERWARGEQHRDAKLTGAQVLEIRAKGESETLRSLASEYGVSKGAIQKILDGKSWRHI